MAKLGRPTKYDPDVTPGKVLEYLKLCQDSYDEKDRLNVKLPTTAGLANHLGVNKDTVQEWKKHPKFSVSLNKLLHEQENRLLDKGLSNEYNSTIAKLILSSNHGYADRKVSESKVDFEVNEKTKSIIDNILDDSKD